MTEINRAALFGRLAPAARKAIETATGFAKMRGNPYVELVHWLHVLIQDPRGDLAAIRAAFGIDDARLAADTVAALDALPRGATAVSDFAPAIEEAIEKGWLYASLQFAAGNVRSGHLVYAMLKTATLRNALFAISAEWRKVQADRLGAEFDQVVQTSAEISVAEAGGPSQAAASPGLAAPGEALAQFSIDLTARARSGEIDRIVGRDAEIRQVVDVLLRRRQNNPILIGEAGVGKTAVVEGFARRIVDGDVPPALQGVTLRALDIALMQAGASVKGEFEKRLRQVIDEVESAPTPVILFIDEAHTLVGAGGQAGTGDAANLLKPALARGRLRTIAATTYAEYRQYFEKDPRADPPLPGGRCRRAGGGPGDRHAAIGGADDGGPSRGGGARRGGGRRRYPVAALRARPPATRQGGEPARHRLRPRRGVATCDAGAGRGSPAPCGAAARRARDRRARSAGPLPRRRPTGKGRRGDRRRRGGNSPALRPNGRPRRRR